MVCKIRKEETGVTKEDGLSNKKRKRSNSDNRARDLLNTISANKQKAEAHLELYKTLDMDAISRCQY